MTQIKKQRNTSENVISDELKEKVIKAVLTVHSQKNEEKVDNSLFAFSNTAAGDEDVRLELTAFKVPIREELATADLNRPTHPHIYRFPLAHPLTSARSRVLLVTRDHPRGRPAPRRPTNIRASNQHYTDMLKTAQCNHLISEVMCVSELSGEYSLPSQQAVLCERIDAVLCDSGLVKLLPRLLGGAFNHAGKHPVGIKLRPTNLKVAVERALGLATHKWSLRDRGSHITFGHTGLASAQLTANLGSCLAHLAQSLPGGWPNVRSLAVRAGPVLVPLYVARGTASAVESVSIAAPQQEVFEEDIGTGRVVLTSGGDVLSYEPEEDCVEEEEKVHVVPSKRAAAGKRKRKTANAANKKPKATLTPSKALPRASRLPMSHVENDLVDFDD